MLVFFVLAGTQRVKCAVIPPVGSSIPALKETFEETECIIESIPKNPEYEVAPESATLKDAVKAAEQQCARGIWSMTILLKRGNIGDKLGFLSQRFHYSAKISKRVFRFRQN